jgi:hypothetical protein
MERPDFKEIFRLFSKLIIIALIVIVCDRGIGKVLNLYYFRLEKGLYGQITYCIDSTTADILILGSSRANHSYVPDVIEEKSGQTCYNAGRDGNYILYNYAVFKAITKRYNPKMIILDISPDELGYSVTEYDRLSLLLPYYQTHPEIREILNLRGPLEKIKRISHIYYYNSLILQIARGNLGNHSVKEADMKGYLPLFKKMKYGTIDTLTHRINSIDENKIRALEDIISTCKQKNINLVFVYSPIWSIIQNSSANQRINDMCSENGIRYLNLSNLPWFIDKPEYFADLSHLNDEGARIFSAMLVNKIWQTN